MNELQGLASALRPGRRRGLRLRKGVVVSEAAGMVTLTLAGDQLTVPKLSQVGALLANDQVWLLTQDANPWLVIGKEA